MLPEKFAQLNDTAVAKSGFDAIEQAISNEYAKNVYYSNDRFLSNMDAEGELLSSKMEKDQKIDDTDIVEMMFTCSQRKTS